MPFIQSGCIVTEYSWEGNVPRVQLPEDDPKSVQTILHVSFDHGAQRLFSSTRICICCDDIVATQALLNSECKIIPHPPSHHHLDTFDEPNLSSLPIFNAFFKIERFPNKLDAMKILSISKDSSSYGPLPSGELMFIEDPQEEPSHILFEINQPLTADSQNVSVSFTSTLFLYTPGPLSTGRCLDGSFSVGRVVRVQPVVLPFDHNHKATHLPTEILLMIFENFYDPPLVYKSWRKDLLSCALVCKQWSCALDLLLSDFRYPGTRGRWTEYPPEICSFANALALRPSLGLSITHLSQDYFFKHPKCKISRPMISTLLVGQSLPYAVPMHLRRFIASFSSILRLAKNLRSLTLFPDPTAGTPELLDALRGLNKLEEVNVQGRLNTPQQIYPYLAMWPTLKRLIVDVSQFDRRIQPIPASPPGYMLTEAILLGRFGDEYLDYILSSSSSSLERLTIHGSFLTDGGLRTTLQGVAKSLVTLRLQITGKLEIFPHRMDKNGEHALDSVIIHMERLKSLTIERDLASDLMIRRRADAFEKRRALSSCVALPTIELFIDQRACLPSPGHSLVVAAASVWPGWVIKISRPLLEFRIRSRLPTRFDTIHFLS